MYLHCGLCGEEWKNTEEIRTTQSPSDYSRLGVGWTKEGLQIWCKRHDCNVMHIDFQGQKHPANMTRKATKKEKMELKKLK